MTWRNESTIPAAITAMMKETKFTTVTAKEADLGCPAPSSLPTLTLSPPKFSCKRFPIIEIFLTRKKGKKINIKGSD